MAGVYALDLRTPVLDALVEGTLTDEQIAERFQIGPATVYRLGRRFRETGSFEPSKTRGHAPRKLSDADVAVLVELVTDLQDATLVELCDELAAATGERISSATTGRDLRLAGFTRKNILRRAGTDGGAHPRALGRPRRRVGARFTPTDHRGQRRFEMAIHDLALVMELPGEDVFPMQSPSFTAANSGFPYNPPARSSGGHRHAHATAGERQNPDAR